MYSIRILLVLSTLLFCSTKEATGQSLGRITFYLDSKQISQDAKDYYNGKLKASDDNKTLSILDSISTSNHMTRPFYLMLVSRMMPSADGVLAEAIGTHCKNFVEQYPNQAIAFLFDAAGNKYLDGWAKVIAGELTVACKDQPKACSRASLAIATKNVKPANKRSLEQFYDKVTAHYQ